MDNLACHSWIMTNLPKELQIMVAQYEPISMYALSEYHILNHNWSNILKLIFNITHVTKYTKHKLMNIYYNMCMSNKKKEIVCTINHIIIKRIDGQIIVCGNNTCGQLGLGHTKNISTFEEIKGLPNNIVEITCGYRHTIIRRANGQLMSCGNNNCGQLGLGHTKNMLHSKK